MDYLGYILAAFTASNIALYHKVGRIEALVDQLENRVDRIIAFIFHENGRKRERK